MSRDILVHWHDAAVTTVDYTLAFNAAFLALSIACIVFFLCRNGLPGHGDSAGERILTTLAAAGLLWSFGGALLPFTGLLQA